MKRFAKILAWITLVFGVPPMLVCIIWLFEGGWRMFLFLATAALPPVPLILVQDSRGWQTPPPAVPIVVAIVSLLASLFVYKRFFSLSLVVTS